MIEEKKVNKMISMDKDLLNDVDKFLKPYGGRLSGLIDHLLENWVKLQRGITDE